MKSIYMIGICGVAMGSLACMLRESGYIVAGSDSNVYPPMSDVLRSAGIHIDEEYDAEKVNGFDLVIIGNSISRGNPQAEHVLNENIPYISLASAMRHFFLQDREVIAVSGTHGKTTTTALLAHILMTAGLDPGFFVGGVTKNYNSNFRIGKGRYFVIEGDEYDSAFFEKVPKFMFYKPRHLIITSLEYDHADIYANLAEIELAFRRLVNIIPSHGSIIYSEHYSILKDIVGGAFAKTKSFGTEGQGDFTCSFREYNADKTNIVLGDTECSMKLFGDFNLANAAAASSMALELGVSIEHIVTALSTFEGVKRRQELIFSSRDVHVFEDFAHHPTAISAVLETMRSRYKHSQIYAVYEPRSATSRRNVFQNELAFAFSNANHVLIKEPFNIKTIPEQERIDIRFVVNEINKSKMAGLYASTDDIVDSLCSRFSEQETKTNEPAFVVLIMSNGGFDGIYEKLIERLSNK